MRRNFHDIDAAKLALENNGFEAELTAEDAALSIKKYTGSSRPEDSVEAREDAQQVIDVVMGGSGPEVRDAEGGAEGEWVGIAWWE